MDGLTGAAQFVVIAQPARRAFEARMLEGDPQMRPIESRLTQIDLPLQLPEGAPARIPVVLRVLCKATECLAAMVRSDVAKLPE